MLKIFLIFHDFIVFMSVGTYIFINFMCIDVFWCICAPCTCSVHQGWKQASDPLRTELQAVESCYMGARIEPGSTGKTDKCF